MCPAVQNLIPPKGSKPTVTGVAVKHIQDCLPDAALLYSSATGISEPNNMAYMVRLGTFGFESLRELIERIKEAGLGASELFACSLKNQGIYLARHAPSADFFWHTILHRSSLSILGVPSRILPTRETVLGRR